MRNLGGNGKYVKITGEIALYDCDKYDYYASVFSGLVAGMIDVLFVGAPGQSSLGNFTDEQTDNVVKKFASMCGWDPKKEKEDSIASAIGFLEKSFRLIMICHMQILRNMDLQWQLKIIILNL